MGDEEIDEKKNEKKDQKKDQKKDAKKDEKMDGEIDENKKNNEKKDQKKVEKKDGEIDDKKKVQKKNEKKDACQHLAGNYDSFFNGKANGTVRVTQKGCEGSVFDTSTSKKLGDFTVQGSDLKTSDGSGR